MRSPTVENYLKALFNLADEEGRVTASALGASLGVSTPSVNSMVRKLSKLDLVAYEKYKPLALTEAGKKAAALVIRKHRLTEMFLVDKMGFGWEEVHAIAEQIEHIESPAFFQKMDDLLGYPSVDPHGSPIPSPEGEFLTAKAQKKLSDCVRGDVVTIVGLAHSANAFLHFLNAREIGLKTQLTVIGVEAYDGSMNVSYNEGTSAILSHVVCQKLLVN